MRSDAFITRRFPAVDKRAFSSLRVAVVIASERVCSCIRTNDDVCSSVRLCFFFSWVYFSTSSCHDFATNVEVRPARARVTAAVSRVPGLWSTDGKKKKTDCVRSYTMYTYWCALLFYFFFFTCLYDRPSINVQRAFPRARSKSKRKSLKIH